MKFPAFSVFVLLLSFLMISTDSIAASEYIEITGRVVNIRSAPSTRSRIVVKAQRGDVFELEEETSNWYKIHLFSAASRYVAKSVARVTKYTPVKPEDESVRREIYKAWFEAQDKARTEAAKTNPPDRDLGKHLEAEQLLNDRLKLELMHTFEVAAPVYRRIMIEGYQKGW